MAYINLNSKPTVNASCDIFSVPPTQRSVEQGYYNVCFINLCMHVHYFIFKLYSFIFLDLSPNIKLSIRGFTTRVCHLRQQ